MPYFLMMVGAPGSGKSTYVKEAKEIFTRKNGLPTTILSTDDYVQWLADKHGMTYNELWKDFYKSAESHMMTMLEYALDHEWNIIWDQTNLNTKTRIRKLTRIPKYYYKIASVFERDFEWLKSINDKREIEGKKLPEFVIKNSINSFECPTLEEGFNSINFNDFDLKLIRKFI